MKSPSAVARSKNRVERVMATGGRPRRGGGAQQFLGIALAARPTPWRFDDDAGPRPPQPAPVEHRGPAAAAAVR